MAFRVKPDFSAVWASLGDSTKPVDSYITNGWETVKPPRQYFNWIDNRQDSAIAYLYQAGVPEWDALVDYEGGAGVNSYSQGSDGKIYRCLADNGPNIVSIGAKDPANPLNSAFWVEEFATKAALTAATANISTLQTQMTNGSGASNPAAWRTALSVDSSTQVDTKITNALTSVVLDSEFTGVNQSKATPGYQKLPGGLILQWGRATTSAAQTPPVVTFPIAFPNAVLNATLSQPDTNTTNSVVWRVDHGTLNSTGFSIASDSFGSSGLLSPANADWFAIGW